MSDNRLRIMKSATELFAARGYDGVGIQEILDAVAVTKPTLYHYFESKQGLLNAVLKEGYTPLIERIRTAAYYQYDLMRTLRDLVGIFFNYAKENGTFYRLSLAVQLAPPESQAHTAAQPYHDELRKIMEELFIKAANDHGNMKGRHAAYAATFVGMINTYIGMYLNREIELNDDLAPRTVQQFMYGIFS
jgi:TetR/AcrR family transcriptional regulator